MASFEAKIGWKRPRKRTSKNYRSVPFRSNITCNRKFQKKLKKLKKKPLLRHFKKLSFRSVPTRRVIENSIKIAKK